MSCLSPPGWTSAICAEDVQRIANFSFPLFAIARVPIHLLKAIFLLERRHRQTVDVLYLPKPPTSTSLPTTTSSSTLSTVLSNHCHTSTMGASYSWLGRKDFRTRFFCQYSTSQSPAYSVSISFCPIHGTGHVQLHTSWLTLISRMCPNFSCLSYKVLHRIGTVVREGGWWRGTSWRGTETLSSRVSSMRG